MKKLNLKKLTTVLGLLSISFGAIAQTDVTATYLTNPDFETSPIAFELPDGTTTLSPQNPSGAGSRVYVPTGWTAAIGTIGASNNAQYARLATVKYGISFTEIPDVLNNALPPATDKNGNEGAGLTISGAFGNIVTLKQEVTLPVGMYTLQYDAINMAEQKNTINTNYFGFEPNEGTPTYATELTFATEWTTYSVEFLITEPTSGAIRIGVGGPNSGSASQAKLYIDNIKLIYNDPFELITPLKEELTQLKESADLPANYDLTDINTLLAVDPLAPGTNTPQLINDLNEAILTLKEAISSNLDATLKELLINNIPFSKFASDIYFYNYYIIPGTITPPTISALATSGYATISVNQASGIPGSATIEVTPGKGLPQTYTLHFEEDYLLGWNPNNPDITPDQAGWGVPTDTSINWENDNTGKSGYRQMTSPFTDKILYVTLKDTKYSFPINVPGGKIYEIRSNIYRRNGTAGQATTFYFNIASSREATNIYSEHTAQITEQNKYTHTSGRLAVPKTITSQTTSYFMVSANGASWDNVGFWEMHLIELGDALTVTFHSDGAETKIPDQYILVGSNETAIQPGDPQKKGYIFMGWYADEDYTTPYNFSDPITTDRTIYAKWGDSKELSISATELSSFPEGALSTIEHLILEGNFNSNDINTLAAKLGTNKILTTIDLTNATVETDATDIFVDINKNALKYFETGATIPDSWSNTIRGTIADEIKLTDDAPFNNIKTFSANTISYIRTFASGWSTFCLPFTIDDIANLGKIEQFTEVKNNSIAFITATSIEANKPYLINTNEGETIFSANNINIPLTNPQTGIFNATFKTLPKEESTGKFILVEEDGKEIFLRASANATISPFRAYISLPDNDPINPTPSYTVTHNGEGGSTNVAESTIAKSGLTVQSSNGEITVTAIEAQKVTITTIDGYLVKSIVLTTNQTVTINNLSTGIYLVNRQKVIVR